MPRAAKTVIVVLPILAVVAAAAIYFVVAPGESAATSNTTDGEPREDSTDSSETRSLANTGDPRIARAADTTISGRVVDQFNQAVAEAEITIGEISFKADARGEFKKIEIPETRSLENIIISADGWYAPVVFLIDHGERSSVNSRFVKKLKLNLGENNLGTIQLKASGAIEGDVVDDRGLRVEGATVAVAGFQRTRIATRTDARGHYLLKQVPPGNVNLTIVLRDRQADSPGVTVSATKTVQLADIVLPRSASERALRGRIVNSGDGEPVAGAQIKAPAAALDNGAAATVYSDTHGKFTLSGIVDTRKMITFDVEGHGYPSKQFGPLYPDDQNLVIALDGGPRFELLVTDALSGQPIEEFGAWTCSPLGSSPDDLHPPIMKHPGGLVRLLASAPRRTRVVVDAPGYPLFEGHVDYSKSTPEVRLPPGSKVKIRAVYGNKPAANVSVSICYTKLPGKSLFSGFVRNPNVAASAGSEYRKDKEGADMGSVNPEIRARQKDAARKTDGAGNCEFESIPPGEYIAIIKDAKGGESYSNAFIVQIGQPVEVLAYITVPGTLAGRVDRETNDPLTIVVKRSDGVDPLFRASGNVDSNGSFTIPGLPPGKYVATLQFGSDASSANFNSASTVSFDVHTGQTTEIGFSPAVEGRGGISGTIRIYGYVPENIKLRWTKTEPSPSREGVATTLQKNGEYEFKNVPPGKITLKLQADNFILSTLGPIDLEPGKSAYFSAEIPLGSVRVRVGARSSGENVDVTVRPAASSGSFSKNIGNGGDAVFPCPPGNVTVSATIDGKAKSANGVVSAGTETFIEL
ncbi:MAG: carboxypeptidase-like regulatory domain-containing protein [Planctomycetota bacterium]